MKMLRLINGQIVSAILFAALLASCAAVPAKLDQGVARRGTPAHYRERWDAIEAKEGKAPQAFKRLYAETLKELNATQAELAKERVSK